LARIAECPIVYLPLGLCEPHGHGAALGLDLLKAEALCVAAARRFGGVVAPSQGYHIHETGYHARWLEEVVGEVNPRMTVVPPHVFLHFFLYQLRAFHNAGFAGTIALTGHSGGNEKDLRLAASSFMLQSSMSVVAVADSELVAGQFSGDHAGCFELSQLMAIRPDLVDKSRLGRAWQHTVSANLGRFAQGEDADAASQELGLRIVEASVERLGAIACETLSAQKLQALEQRPRLGYAEVEAAWARVLEQRRAWVTESPMPGQAPVTQGSQWKPLELAPDP
jgi:creatinine amidohydrolase